jgi:hypothetical protein
MGGRAFSPFEGMSQETHVFGTEHCAAVFRSAPAWNIEWPSCHTNCALLLVMLFSTPFRMEGS